MEVTRSLDDLLRDLTLVTIALAIALGWSLFRFASGVSQMISTLLTDYPNADGLLRASEFQEPLTWSIGDRILTLGALMRGAVEFGTVMLVALLVRKRQRASRLANP
jgi:hypothetical protein